MAAPPWSARSSLISLHRRGKRGMLCAPRPTCRMQFALPSELARPLLDSQKPVSCPALRSCTRASHWSGAGVAGGSGSCTRAVWWTRAHTQMPVRISGCRGEDAACLAERRGGPTTGPGHERVMAGASRKQILRSARIYTRVQPSRLHTLTAPPVAAQGRQGRHMVIDLIAAYRLHSLLRSHY